MSGPDVVLWRPAEVAARPMVFGPALHVLDVRGVRPGGVGVPAACGLLLVGSEAARGAWAEAAGEVPIAVVPRDGGRIAAGTRVERVHVRVGDAPDGARIATAEAAAAWARQAGVGCGIEGAATAAALAVAGRVGSAPAAGPGSVVLDLRAGWERLEPCALGAAGVPVVTSVDALAGLTPGRYRALAGRALAGRALVGEKLVGAVAAARAGQALRRAHWAAGVAPHVLVITGEAENLVDVRVHGPFGALQRAGAIAGYSVLRAGALVFSTADGLHPGPLAGGEGDERRFGAVWVQRSAAPAVLLLLRALRTGFAYDLDDLLTVSPSYRPAFSEESRETVRALAEAASVVSCATEGLGQRLGVAAGRIVVTPNLAAGESRVVAGAARCVVWASSDRPALAGSRGAVERAVRDFCRAHGLSLLCLGETAPAVFRRAGIAVETAGLLPYAAYMERLRAAAPGILVGPLETAGDADTQSFVASKSDIKVIEARLSGLVGVFSRAGPYLDSDLAPAVLCENSYEGWLAGLERARGLCAQPSVPPPWPAWRDAGQLGLVPWAAAVRAGAADLSVGEVRDALAYVREQMAAVIGAPERFDEAAYLRRHPDVAGAVRAGSVPSGYSHYVQHGFREGRQARELPEPGAGASVWWGRLLHAAGRLERTAAEREVAVGRLLERAALAPALPDGSGAEDALPGPLPGGEGFGDGGGVVAGGCPVCGAAGPHGVVLRQAGQVLARCGVCGSCAAEERVVHEYGHDPQADVLLQLYLEQNAGIHQQTGLLFASAAGGSVLDVGCGFGFAVDLARRVLGWRAVGVDPSFQAAAGRRVLGADIRHEALTSALDLGERFAVVIASEVIEHLPEPYGFLRLLRERVAAGGVLVLTTPDAGALAPGIGPARMMAITAPRVHLVLFTGDSLVLALRRAGFGEVRLSRVGDGLVAVASERPIVVPQGAALQHVAAYRRYLETLVGEAEAGSALWNGAAGRLLALIEPTAAMAEKRGLVGRIAAAWRARFGFDLEALALPEPEAGEDAAALAGRQPLNLGPVLLRRAAMAEAPGERLRFARAACRVASHTGRVLQAGNMIDHDLRQTAWRARAMVVEALQGLAPEVPLAAGAPEGEWPLDLAAGPGQFVAADRIAGATKRR